MTGYTPKRPVKKPKFPTDGARIHWTAWRIDYVRYCAEDLDMTAREIAADIGLDESQRHRVFAVCRREKIDLKGTGPKRKPRELYVPVAVERMPVLRELARTHDKLPREIARLILDAALSEGVVYCNNLLDLE
jgi:hypothetical protein